MARFAKVLVLMALIAGGGDAARGAFIVDPAGDFLATYTGPRNGDLDVLAAGVTFDGTRFTLTGTLNGAIGTTAGALYVWGVDRGAGTARFGALAPGVTFDSVVSLTATRDAAGNLVGSGTVNRLFEGGSTALGAGDVVISGNTITASVLASLLPGQGLAAANYTFNLWPRFGTGNAAISDFAPDNANFAAGSVPEPSSLILCSLAAIGGLGWRAARSRA